VMVNPGAFRGSRRIFLTEQVDGYMKAIKEGRVAKYIADVIHQYLKQYPLSLTHNDEPSPEHLASIDDNAPDPE
ncbi:hypothetical protein ARMSODRAFT_857283, partial [Armillaria solidipes]